MLFWNCSHSFKLLSCRKKHLILVVVCLFCKNLRNFWNLKCLNGLKEILSRERRYCWRKSLISKTTTCIVLCMWRHILVILKPVAWWRRKELKPILLLSLKGLWMLAKTNLQEMYYKIWTKLLYNRTKKTSSIWSTVEIRLMIDLVSLMRLLSTKLFYHKKKVKRKP